MDRFLRVLGETRRAAAAYDMIADGDRVAVGVSGGKDSTTLLYALAALRGFYPKRFDILAVTVDIGFDGMDFSPVSEACASLGVEYVTVKTQIAEIVFDRRRERNSCSLCARLRRGALVAEAAARGCSKLALGHHKDDVVDTFIMNLIHGGRISTFEPVTYLPDHNVSVIRPLVYVREYELIRAAESRGVPVVENTCPNDGESERQRAKELIRRLGADYPTIDITERIFGAIERAGIDGWHESPRALKRRG